MALPISRYLLLPNPVQTTDKQTADQDILAWLKNTLRYFRLSQENPSLIIDLLKDRGIKHLDTKLLFHFGGNATVEKIFVGTISQIINGDAKTDDGKAQEIINELAKKLVKIHFVDFIEKVAAKYSYKDTTKNVKVVDYTSASIDLAMNGIKTNNIDLGMIHRVLKEKITLKDKIEGLQEFEFVENIDDLIVDEDESSEETPESPAYYENVIMKCGDNVTKLKDYKLDDQEYFVQRKKYDIKRFFRSLENAVNSASHGRNFLMSMILIRDYEPTFYTVLRRIFGIFIGIMVCMLFPGFWLGLIKSMWFTVGLNSFGTTVKIIIAYLFIGFFIAVLNYD